MKHFLFLFISLYSFSGICQSPIAIEGNFARDNFVDVKLFSVENGALKEMATVKPNKEGKFGFNFFPDYEGYYLVGTGTALAPQNNFKFWLKPGDKLAFSITDSTYELTGNQNTKANKILEQWYKMTWPIELKSVYFNKTLSTYVDFFPELLKFLPTSRTWLSKQKPTGDQKFDSRLEKTIQMDIAFYALNFLNTPRTAHPDAEEIPEYYKGITVDKYLPNTQDVYFYPWGQRLLADILAREVRRDVGDKNFGFEISQLPKSLKYISNDTLKGDYALQRLAFLKDYTEYLSLEKEVDDYILTNAQKEEEFRLNSALATLKPGDKGYEFKYEDNSGKMVSFSDLRGKVVLVDTWATWCGPCKVEIPYLKELEKEMKGKDVAIISLSVDEEKDKQKWEQMIKDENLGGIQLFARGWSDFAKYYKINAIPRFLVFDKSGRIVSVDAPRPSNPELKILIEKHL